MAIQNKARKLLWARAHDECAFPGCSQKLTSNFHDPTTGRNDATVIGQEAHIRAQSPGGARYDSEYEDVDAYENLMLMCPTHHIYIDSNEGRHYTVDDLVAMKRKHEQQQFLRDPHHRALRAYLGDRFVAENSIQFQQVDLRGPSVESMFVDVPIGCRRDAKSAAAIFEEIIEKAPGDTVDLASATGLIVAGATQVLLDPKWTGNAVLVGGPGQGKSTVLQFICQFHRARLLGRDEYTAGRSGLAREATTGRFPIRVDLRRYAEWALKPADGQKGKKRARRASQTPDETWRSLESYIIQDVQAHIGENKFEADDLAALIAQEPVLLALDGLDEVASIQTRARVTREISAVHGRLGADASDLMILVATRPGSSLQPLASAGFPVLHLQRLTQGLRLQYLQRWVEVADLSPDAASRLQATFMSSQHVAHINELASYPMQLAILLHLLHRRQLLPEQRTDLYREYLKTFLDREQTEDKEPLLDDQRRVLEDTHAYLGWYLQAKAEQGDAAGSISKEELRSLLRDQLAGQPEAQKLAEEIYSAITDRVLCLVERNGSFEFEVQSLREYFAALHMFENLTARGQGNSRDDGLDALLERPYWANVCRFFVGMLARGEVRAFRGNLDIANKKAHPHPLVRGMAALVLSDRIYSGQPDVEVQDVVDFVLAGPGVVFAEDGNLDASGSPLRFSSKAGRAQAVQHLKARLAAHPVAPLAVELAKSLEAHATPHDEIVRWWWSLNDGTESWLRTGSILRAFNNLESAQIPQLRAAVSRDAGGFSWHVESLVSGAYDGNDDAILATAKTEINSGAVDVLSRATDGSALSRLIRSSYAAVSNLRLPIPSPEPAATSPTSVEATPFELARRLNSICAEWGDGWVLRRAVAMVPRHVDLLDMDPFVTRDELRAAIANEQRYRTNKSDSDWWASELKTLEDSSQVAMTILAMLRHAHADVIVQLDSVLAGAVDRLEAKHFRALERVLAKGSREVSTRRIHLDEAFRLRQFVAQGPILWLLWLVSTDASRDRIGRAMADDVSDILRSGVSDGQRLLGAIHRAQGFKTSLFEDTRALFPHGTGVLYEDLTYLTPTLARSILREPERWPVDIVSIASDRMASVIAAKTPPLADLASQNRWFARER